MSQERRLRRRVNLSAYLSASDTVTTSLLGKVVEMNPAGFLLLTESPYPVGAEYSINIQLPEVIAGVELINCKAVVSRVGASPNQSLYEVGFEIRYMSSESKKVIEILQEKWELHFPT